MSEIVKLYEKISLDLSVPSVKNKLRMSISTTIQSAYNKSMQSNDGYCFKFTLPLTVVTKEFYKILNLTQEEVFKAYQKDWGPSAMKNFMYRDPYYQILLLLFYYGLRQKDDFFTKNSLMIIFFKLWNGRKSKYLPYCDPKIMKYVISNMMSNKYHLTKYDTPLNLISEYFVPTIIKKYGPEILRNPNKLYNCFQQCYGRINQLFVSNKSIDVGGGSKYRSGIMPLYIKAKQEGLHISNQNVYGSDSEDPTFDQYATTNLRQEIADTVSDFITMNPNPHYNKSFINTVNKTTKVSAKAIEKILLSVHNHIYYDQIHDLIILLLSRTNVTDRTDICKTEFFDKIRKNVISSKNNEETRKIQKILDYILTDIFKNSFPEKNGFKSYSTVQQIQIRNVVIYGLVLNLRRRVCKNEVLGMTHL